MSNQNIEANLISNEIDFLIGQRKYKQKALLRLTTTNDNDRIQKIDDELAKLSWSNLTLFLLIKEAELEKRYNTDPVFAKLVLQRSEDEKNKTTS